MSAKGQASPGTPYVLATPQDQQSLISGVRHAFK